MFESAELGHEISDKDFKKEELKLRAALLEAQFELYESARFETIVLIGGVDGAGKGPTVNTLNAWMDARLILTNAMGPPTEEERERPPMWRFWRALLPKEKVGVFFGSWYTRPIIDRVMGHSDDADLDRALEEIIRFETMLAEEGALVLKFWMHLSKKRQKKRLKRLEKDPHLSWKVTDQDWERFEHYDEFVSTSAHSIRLTNSAHAPWIVVEGEDANFRELTVGKTILHSLRDRLDNPGAKVVARQPPIDQPIDGLRIVNGLDMTKSVEKKDYEKELVKLQGRLNALARDKRFQKDHALVAVFEGPDAAGKGGSIRRTIAALDARFYRVIPIAAPTDEERAHPYLWRFWRRIPMRGHWTIYDRSWYGRVLVERVEGFAPERDWMRAYREINDFEAELARHGVIVAKFWLHITAEEQLARFNDRKKIAHKKFKLTDEDWRNRDTW